ncbi:WD40 repeat domain-containing protein [Paenibacillus sp. MBLB4367]|uniref:WD40 repeat domain-containing protein n=1 Tax=Paenibacillus sp. MBLB4367 TaxID=3384767 RepID=UPI0039080F43
MKRFRVYTIIVLLTFLTLAWQPLSASAKEKAGQPKAAFVRDGGLWLKVNDNESRIDRGNPINDIAWSADGKLLAYVKPGKGAWIYDTETKRGKQVFAGLASNLRWSPAANLLAFQDDGILNVVDAAGPLPKSFANVTGGVGSYAWDPDGQSFLVSTSSHLTPAGWTDIQIYKVPVTENFDTTKSALFYTIPNDPGQLFAVGTTTFKWSADGRWIAFIAFPTASLSMDSNSLCLLSADGRTFRKIDDMLGHVNWFQWAPEGALLGYIGGQGRFYSEPKQLRLYDPSAPDRTLSLTPQGMLDTGFTWQSPALLTVSRSKAAGNTEITFQFPMSSLVNQSAGNPADARTITKPPHGLGDAQPQYLPANRQIAWLRTNGKGGGDIWLADADGRNQRLWVRGVNGEYAVYVGTSPKG